MAFIPWRAARATSCRAVAAEERGGAAHVEPVGVESGGLDGGECLLKLGELGLGGAAIGFVGGVEVGHDALRA